MRVDQFSASRSGELVRIPEGGVAFVPDPLPPRPGSFSYTPAIVRALSEAEAELGRLDGMGHMLPDPELLIQPFLRREAVMSSRIEGTQTTLPGLLLFEAAQATNDVQDPEAQEVANYILALDYGLQECEHKPISRSLIRGLHRHLMANVGPYGAAESSDFRDRQVYIAPKGAPIRVARYVPPPADRVSTLFEDFESFINDPNQEYPLLIRLAITHYQFEAIHPFIDGNGRIGRLLLALMLCTEGRLSKPMLYLSAFFEEHREEYYDLLLAVSRQGAWEEWILFFLQAVREQAHDAIIRTRNLFRLRDSYRERFSGARSTALLLTLVDRLFAFPVITAPIAQRQLKISYPTARDLIAKMVKAQVLSQHVQSARAHYFIAHDVINVIEGPLSGENLDIPRGDAQVTNAL